VSRLCSVKMLAQDFPLFVRAGYFSTSILWGRIFLRAENIFFVSDIFGKTFCLIFVSWRVILAFPKKSLMKSDGSHILWFDFGEQVEKICGNLKLAFLYRLQTPHKLQYKESLNFSINLRESIASRIFYQMVKCTVLSHAVFSVNWQI